MGFTVKQVDKLIREARPGATADGDGLYLKIGPTGAASWQLRFQIDGKRRMMGLGSCAAVSLAEARDKASEMRKLVKQGVDPLTRKEVEKTAALSRAVTFRDVARTYIESHRAGWRSAKHAAQWESTLETYAHPWIGNKTIAEIGTADVLAALRPIWQTKPETANRVRNRIELVIDAARAQGLSMAANPAVWRGHLDKVLPKRPKASKAHHAALSYREMPAFFDRLTSERRSLSAAALALTVLTACRTSEVLLAEWREFDLEARTWALPAARMKAGREHRVPLSSAAVKILESLEGPREGFVFPGARAGRPLSNMAMTMVLRKLGHADLTVHGFRSTFRDWAAEETHYANIVAEQALAHTVGNAVESAYRRGDLLERRRALMEDWANYCTATRADNVVVLRATA